MNKKVLITAGPTHEAIDPVRFIGNHSTGKMGYAIADAFAKDGADVTLISGPSSLHPGNPAVKLIRVNSAAEMYAACKEHIDASDIAVFSAAVADFTPESKADHKIKREKDDLVIRLKPTVDIAGSLGKGKRDNQLFIGFALETRDALDNAKGKIVRKNLDLIVLNSLEDKGAGFGTDTNKITLIDKSGNIDTFGLKQKSEVAVDIIEKTKKLLEDA